MLAPALTSCPNMCPEGGRTPFLPSTQPAEGEAAPLPVLGEGVQVGSHFAEEIDAAPARP